MEISPILIPLAAIGGVFITAILLRKFDNDERMAMIQKGLNPYTPKPRPHKSNAMITFHFAAIVIGLSLGLLIGHMLDRLLCLYKLVAYFSIFMLFYIIGMLISYFN